VIWVSGRHTRTFPRLCCKLGGLEGYYRIAYTIYTFSHISFTQLRMLKFVHVATFGFLLSRCLVTFSHVPVLVMSICFRQIILSRPLLLVRSMASLDTEIMSELAASLEGAVGVAL
jgi:hypothetical protein